MVANLNNFTKESRYKLIEILETFCVQIISVRQEFLKQYYCMQIIKNTWNHINLCKFYILTLDWALNQEMHLCK